MDAKPQRRPLAVYKDEPEAAKVVAGGRMKNAIASSASQVTNGIQGRAKRAAFAQLNHNMKATSISEAKGKEATLKSAVLQPKNVASQPALRATNGGKQTSKPAVTLKASNSQSENIPPVGPSKTDTSSVAAMRKTKQSTTTSKSQMVQEKPKAVVREEPKKQETKPSVIVTEKPIRAGLVVDEEMKVGLVQATIDSDTTDPEPTGGDHAHDISEDEDDLDIDDEKTSQSNITSGLTVTIFPKATAKDRKELAAAELQYGGEVDEADEWDITMVTQYGEEIFSYMRELEVRLLPNPNYMDHQNEIQWSMRSVLMDWIVQVHARFQLLPETLFLTANYVDRFLSAKVVSLGKLQLVGATALFIAAKYEEISCPSIHEIEYMVDRGYSIEEIMKAERYMLTMLRYELGWPGPLSFLRRISKADDYDLETRTLAKYFLEVTVMDERFVGTPPSFLAAGAHFLARHMLGKGTWTPAHVYYSGYTASQLDQLVHTLVECCENARQHHNAIFEKFSEKRNKRASLFVENWMKNSTSPQAPERD